MLERELRNGDTGWDVNGAADVTSCLVYCLPDLAEILGVCDEYFRAGTLLGGCIERDLRQAHPFPAMLMTPTVFSGLESILVWKTMLTASACASKRVGA